MCSTLLSSTQGTKAQLSTSQATGFAGNVIILTGAGEKFARRVIHVGELSVPLVTLYSNMHV
jgi:hypothetical protein